MRSKQQVRFARWLHVRFATQLSLKLMVQRCPRGAVQGLLGMQQEFR